MALILNPNSNDDSEWQRFGKGIEREVFIRTIIRNVTPEALAHELKLSAQEMIDAQEQQDERLNQIIKNANHQLTMTLLNDIKLQQEQSNV